MADGQNLLRPLRSDSLKPRPSTQAVWEPRKPAPQPSVWNPPPEKAEPAMAASPEPEAAAVEPLFPFEPETAEETVSQREPPVETSAPPVPDPFGAEAAEEEPLPDPQSFLFETFAPEVSSEPPPDPVCEEPADEASLSEEASLPEEEEPFDLDAVIASILAEEDEDGEDDAPAAPDALPSETMPAPAFVPLYAQDAPKRKKKGWLWLAPVVLAAVGAAAAWYFGWLDGILP